MTTNVQEFGLGIQTNYITPLSKSFRPPSWPPPSDWVIIEDRNGKPLSLYGASLWDLSVLRGKTMQLNFNDDPKLISRDSQLIDPANAGLLRLMTAWRMFGPKAITKAASLDSNFFRVIKPVVALCSREGILASELMRFPRVLEQVPGEVASSQFDTLLTELHRLWDYRDQIGFVILDQKGIAKLSAMNPNHERVQTAYIPPRIWVYQVSRLRECLDDFLIHKSQIEACFTYSLDAYIKNCGSLEAAVTGNFEYFQRPFFDPNHEMVRGRTGFEYLGPFEITAEKFCIKDLIARWVTTGKHGFGLKSFASYLSLIERVGLAYILNFTLQRSDEGSKLRTDCLYFEDDDKLGQVPIICGETTKTSQDSDARWPTSPSVQVAVDAMTSIARLRMRCIEAHPIVATTEKDRKNPYLINAAYDPWSGNEAKTYAVRSNVRPYGSILADYPKLFDANVLKINNDDLRIARTLTPNLSDDKFAVGMVWPLAYHQLRRTGAVNMFASGLLSNSSLQYLLKHSNRLMPLYYGRGYTKLKLNESVEQLLISTMYETMAQSLLNAMGESFISPHQTHKSTVINLIEEKNVKELVKMAKSGTISFRENRLGGCMSRDPCEYGGIESIARCAGGDGKSSCPEALFDKRKRSAIENDLQKLKVNIGRLPDGSPRQAAWQEEINGMELYLNAIQSK